MGPLAGYKTQILAVVSVLVWLLTPVFASHGISPDTIQKFLTMLGFGAIVTFRMGMADGSWHSYAAGVLGILTVAAEAIGVIPHDTAVQLDAILFGGGAVALRQDLKKVQGQV